MRKNSLLPSYPFKPLTNFWNFLTEPLIWSWEPQATFLGFGETSIHRLLALSQRAGRIIVNYTQLVKGVVCVCLWVYVCVKLWTRKNAGSASLLLCGWIADFPSYFKAWQLTSLSRTLQGDRQWALAFLRCTFDCMPQLSEKICSLFCPLSFYQYFSHSLLSGFFSYSVFLCIFHFQSALLSLVLLSPRFPSSEKLCYKCTINGI